MYFVMKGKFQLQTIGVQAPYSYMQECRKPSAHNWRWYTDHQDTFVEENKAHSYGMTVNVEGTQATVP